MGEGHPAQHVTEVTIGALLIVRGAIKIDHPIGQSAPNI
jgi:hypothetical protein